MLMRRSAEFAFVLLMLVPAVVSAQYGIATPSQGLSASGAEKVPLKAEKIRLLMVIKAQGADAKAAVLALSEHKERVKKELESMKADKDSIAFSATQVASGDGDEEGAARMMQMQMMRSSGGGASPDRKSMPTIFTATCALKAEWPLPVQEGDALAVLPATLREQITTRDFAGEKNKPKLSKADQGKFDELQAMMQESYSYSSGSDAAGPRIVFTAKVPDDVKQKALHAAFEKAVKEVKTLSSGAGITLGKLVGLYSMSPTSMADQIYRASYNNPAAAQIGKFEQDEDTVSADHADELALEVTVSVTYSLE